MEVSIPLIKKNNSNETTIKIFIFFWWLISNDLSNCDGPFRLLFCLSLGRLLGQDMALPTVLDVRQKTDLRAIGALLDQFVVKEGLWQELENHISKDSLGQCLIPKKGSLRV